MGCGPSSPTSNPSNNAPFDYEPVAASTEPTLVKLPDEYVPLESKPDPTDACANMFKYVCLAMRPRYDLAGQSNPVIATRHSMLGNIIAHWNTAQCEQPCKVCCDYIYAIQLLVLCGVLYTYDTDTTRRSNIKSLCADLEKLFPRVDETAAESFPLTMKCIGLLKNAVNTKHIENIQKPHKGDDRHINIFWNTGASSLMPAENNAIFESFDVVTNYVDTQCLCATSIGNGADTG